MKYLILFFIFISFPLFSDEGDNFEKFVMQFSSADPQKRIDAMYELSKSGRKEAIDILKKGLNDKNEEVRINACFFLGALKDKRAKDALFQATIHDPSQVVAIHSAEALYNMGYKASFKIILAKLKSKEEDTVLLALEKIEILNDKQATPDLKKLIKVRNERSILNRAGRILQIFNSELPGKDVIKSRSKVDESRKMLSGGNLIKAKELIEEAILLDSTNPQASYLLAVIYSKKKETEERSLSLYKKAEALGYPYQGDLYIELGSLYLEKGDNLNALEYLKKGALIKKSARGYYQLAAAYANNAKIDLAIEYCLKSIEIDPSLKLAYFSLGKLYSIKGDGANSKKYTDLYVKLSKEE